MAYESQVTLDTTSVSDAISSRRGKLSTNFTFSANDRTVTINDTDFIQFLYIANVTRSMVLFQPAIDGNGGTISGQTITLEARTNGMADNDTLIVVYEATELNSEEIIEQGETLDNLLTESTDQGTTLDNQLTESLNQGLVQDGQAAEQLAQGVVQDSQAAEQLAQGVVQDGQAAEQLAQGVVQDSQLTEQKDQGLAQDFQRSLQEELLKKADIIIQHLQLITEEEI